MTIPASVELPDDTTARVQTDGLLGGAYIGLEPGGGFDIIVPCGVSEQLFEGESGCGEIIYAQGSVDLMTLFASFASGSASGGDGE
jgi:phospholipid/cholesterol/gamma-HCH transport system substrate-binding protein